jgi:imidazolonepropionase-like amidohydrolase
MSCIQSSAQSTPSFSGVWDAYSSESEHFKMEAPMRQMNVVAVAIVILGFLAGFAIPASAQSVTAYEGARLIVGDGRVIENATLVVESTKIAQAGTATEVRAPAGATRVNLAGKTVMPMVIDAHVHLSPTRDAVLRDLSARAYYGVSAVLREERGSE